MQGFPVLTETTRFAKLLQGMKRKFQNGDLVKRLEDYADLAKIGDIGMIIEPITKNVFKVFCNNRVQLWIKNAFVKL